MFGLKALEPRIDRGPGYLQETADAHLLPALIVELDDLQPGLGAIGLGMIVPEPQVALTRDGTVLSEFVDGLIIISISELDKQDARQFPVGEPVIDNPRQNSIYSSGERS